MPLKYPNDVQSVAADLDVVRLEASLESVARVSYSAFWSHLSKDAAEAVAVGRLAEARILWLLAETCSLATTPESSQAVFEPSILMGDRRSVASTDFTADDIQLLGEIAPVLRNPWLQARAFDFAWVMRRPKRYQDALGAIDAYRRLPLAPETWESDIRQCWTRAMVLAALLKKAGEGRFLSMEAELLAAFRANQADQTHYALSIAKILLKYGKMDGSEAAIAEQLRTIGTRLADQKNLTLARAYFHGAVDWYDAARDVEAKADVTCLIAESWASEAASRIADERPSNMVGASHYEKSIQVFRSIPRKQRPSRNVEVRIAELLTKMTAAGENALLEMNRLSSGTFDISEEVEKARRKVAGKSAQDAVRVLINLYAAKKQSLQTAAATLMQEHPFQTLFPASHVSKDGRVIAKLPGLGASGPQSDEYQQVLWSKTVAQYVYEVSFVAKAWLWPALEVVTGEHRLEENEFVEIARNSSVIPPGREELVGKGLFRGFNRDFASAIHLLTPQLENVVRIHLKSAGAKTTNLDSEGVENENGLSALVDLPEMERVFGENVAFEFKALFCDPFGPNLRNELAHGLLDQDASQSLFAFYAWWFALRLVLSAFWNSATQSDAEQARN
jgi:hypothetical protein